MRRLSKKTEGGSRAPLFVPAGRQAREDGWRTGIDNDRRRVRRVVCSLEVAALGKHPESATRNEGSGRAVLGRNGELNG